MTRTTIAIALALIALTPVPQAAAQNNTLGGALLGGTAGAIIGGAATGRAGGAVAGGYSDPAKHTGAVRRAILEVFAQEYW